MSRVALAGCARCGDIEVAACDVRLGPGPSGASKLVYRLVCPSCRVLLLRPVDALTVCVLLAAGARWESWEWPLELMERPDESVQPLTEQEVAAFVQLLTALPVAPGPGQ